MERWVSKVSGIIAPMSLCACLSALARAAGRQIPCRGCLAPLGEGAEAGLCRACWEGLVPLPALRCPRCALPHGADRDCPEPVAWSLGDALWDYHGGRPPLGALLVPAIKAGELAWMQALHRRMAEAPLPSWAAEADCATCVPTPLPRRLLRGFDLAEDTARLLADCGLGFDPACLRFHEARRSVRTASAAQVRQPLQMAAQRALAYGVLLEPLLAALGLPVG